MTLVEGKHISDVLQHNPVGIGLGQESEDMTDETAGRSPNATHSASLREVCTRKSRSQDVNAGKRLDIGNVIEQFSLRELSRKNSLGWLPVLDQDLGVNATVSEAGFQATDTRK